MELELDLKYFLNLPKPFVKYLFGKILSMYMVCWCLWCFRVLGVTHLAGLMSTRSCWPVRPCTIATTTISTRNGYLLFCIKRLPKQTTVRISSWTAWWHTSQDDHQSNSPRRSSTRSHRRLQEPGTKFQFCNLAYLIQISTNMWFDQSFKDLVAVC